MSFKLFIGIVILAALAGAGWFYRDTPEVRRWIPPALYTLTQAPPSKSGAAPGPAAAAAAAGVHKCRQGGKLVYTNGDCPPGSVEQPVSGGSVTVVPAQQAAESEKKADAAAAPPDVRDLLGKAPERNLQKERLEKAVSQ